MDQKILRNRGEKMLAMVGISLEGNTLPAPQANQETRNDCFTEEDFEDFSADDSLEDPNYQDNSSPSTSSLEELQIEKKKTRKRIAKPSEWIKNRAKFLRNSGQSYQTQKKRVIVPARYLKQPCNDSNCREKCTTKFTEEERQAIFKRYWDMAGIVQQRIYILSLIEEVNSKNKKLDGSRANNHAFYFLKKDQKIRVCKNFFIATLGITNRCIRTIKSKIKENSVALDLRGKHGNHKEVPKHIKDEVRFHISSIPAIESHYTRAHSDKVYIEGSKTIAELHRDYKLECQGEGKPFANLTMYRRIFNNEFNIAFFTPKKDQCQNCVSYENSTEAEKQLLEANHTAHLEEKKLSREDKERDKNNISRSFQVACFDLQASLPTPNGQVSSFYYRSKLQTYNFTICDLTQKGQGPVNCYMWHEGEGKRGAIEIGTCLLNYLKEKADASNNEDLDIVFYSDNCAGQQKNKYVVATYLYAVCNYNIKSITHKFLVTGHTQNEGDNVHSLIEKNIKRALKSGPIYTPAQYVTLVRTAKKTGKPYNVIEMTHEDFFDLKGFTEQTCSNFNKNSIGENFKFSDVSIFRVDKQDLDCFFYKLSFKDTEFKSVKINNERRKRAMLPSLLGFQLENAYNEAIPITKKKYDDLMSLINSKAIIRSHSNFYTSLNYK